MRSKFCVNYRSQSIIDNREILICEEILNLFNEDKIGGTSELQSPRLLNQSHLKLEAKLEESSE